MPALPALLVAAALPAGGAAWARGPCGQGAARPASGLALRHDAGTGHPVNELQRRLGRGPGGARLPVQPGPTPEARQGRDRETLATLWWIRALPPAP